MDGTRVERKADLKAVAWRRVERTAIVECCLWGELWYGKGGERVAGR